MIRPDRHTNCSPITISHRRKGLGGASDCFAVALGCKAVSYASRKVLEPINGTAPEKRLHKTAVAKSQVQCQTQEGRRDTVLDELPAYGRGMHAKALGIACFERHFGWFDRTTMVARARFQPPQADRSEHPVNGPMQVPEASRRTPFRHAKDERCPSSSSAFSSHFSGGQRQLTPPGRSAATSSDVRWTVRVSGSGATWT